MEAKEIESKPKTLDGTEKDPKLLNVVVDKKLYEILSPVVPLSPMTTLSKVLDALKFYICKKELFDPLQPARIIMENDELKSVFGMSECLISDIMQFIPKIVCPVNGKHAGANFFADPPNALVGCKRKIENGIVGAGPASTSIAAETSTDIVQPTDSFLAKKAKTEYLFLMIPPSPSRKSTSDSSESIQGFETSLVKDTTDSETDISIIAVEQRFDVEYEIESDSTECFLDDTDDDEIFPSPEALQSIIDVICKSESDTEYLGDESEDGDDEISGDEWKCKSCLYDKNLPFSGSCHKCFGLRTGWLPPARRENRKRQRRLCKSQRKRAQKMEKIPSITEERVATEGESSSPSSQNSLSCDIPSSSSQESNTLKNPNCNNLVAETNLPKHVCFLCCSEPINGIIIHRNTKFAHSISCYNCAKKLKSQQQKCPVCRRSIDRVVYSVLS